MFIKVPVSFMVKNMEKGDKKFLKNTKSFGTFSIMKDLPYIDDGDEYHKLDVLAPVLGKENGIVLFYIHGGAYLYGKKEYAQIFNSWFTNQGYTVVSINYRLIDLSENIDIEDQIRDVFAAIKFVYEFRHEYKLNFDKFCLMGDSAGGHLCLMTDLVMHSKELQEYYKISDVPPVDIKCIALNSTMYNFKSLVPLARKYLTKKGTKKVLGNRCFDDEFIKQNSPKNYVEKGYKFSPLFNSSSYHDYFNGQSLGLKHDAKTYNLDLEFLFETSPRKCIGHIYNHFVFDDEGLKCNNAMSAFFKKHCGVE